MVATSAGIASLETTARISRFGIWAVMIAVVPVVALYALLMVAQLGGGFPSPVLYGLIAGANALFYLLFVLSGIAVLCWIWRAHANLRDAGLDELKHSPAWAVICWFIPIVSLVVPFTSMRALYNRSHGEEAWNADAPVDDILTWWACYILGGLILTFTTLTFAINALPGVWLTTPPAADTGLNIGGFLLLAISARFLMKIIRAITDAQRQGMNSAAAFE